MKTNETWPLNAVAGFVARARLARYNVQEFGALGWTIESDGEQIFRATAMGNERYDVRYNDMIFADI